MMEPKLTELKSRLAEIHDLDGAASVLFWDQQTYLPPGGGTARGQQLATLQRLSHEKFTSDEIGRLLADLQAVGESLPYESDDASLLRLVRREYERRCHLPADFVARAAEA